jgi:hypothetical protein
MARIQTPSCEVMRTLWPPETMILGFQSAIHDLVGHARCVADGCSLLRMLLERREGAQWDAAVLHHDLRRTESEAQFLCAALAFWVDLPNGLGRVRHQHCDLQDAVTAAVGRVHEFDRLRGPGERPAVVQVELCGAQVQVACEDWLARQIISECARWCYGIAGRQRLPNVLLSRDGPDAVVMIASPADLAELDLGRVWEPAYVPRLAEERWRTPSPCLHVNHVYFALACWHLVALGGSATIGTGNGRTTLTLRFPILAEGAAR